MAFLFYWQSCSIPPWVKDFSLTDSNRKTVTAKDLGKKPSAIFFGYTMFPDICPAMLASIENRVRELGPDADKPDFRFITVDPEQDTLKFSMIICRNLPTKLPVLGVNRQKFMNWYYLSI